MIQSNRGYYVELTFLKYAQASLFQSFNPFGDSFGGVQGIGGRGRPVTATGGIKLPLPKKINDAQTLSWQEVSATQTALQFALGLWPSARATHRESST